jgi:hypothetical protein
VSASSARYQLSRSREPTVPHGAEQIHGTSGVIYAHEHSKHCRARLFSREPLHRQRLLVRSNIRIYSPRRYTPEVQHSVKERYGRHDSCKSWREGLPDEQPPTNNPIVLLSASHADNRSARVVRRTCEPTSIQRPASARATPGRSQHFRVRMDLFQYSSEVLRRPGELLSCTL